MAAKKASARAPKKTASAKTKTTAKSAARTAKKTASPKTQAKKAPIERRSALGFRVNEHVVYPAHGVGRIIEITEQKVAEFTLELFVLDFDKEKMIVRVPVTKAKEIGMRKLADKKMLDGAMRTLRGRARIKRTMWSRRAQEYEAKINSGDLIAVSEVVRDLYRNENQPEQSYSERQLYEAALERMVREYSTLKKITDDEAVIELEAILAETTGGVSEKSTDEEDATENAA